MSLSAATTASRRILVVGSGAIGLRTSMELLQRGAEVALLSPEPPLAPTNCSQGAGGLWMPYHCDDARVDRWAMETLDELYPMAKDDANPLVEWVPCVSLKRQHSGPTTQDFVSKDYDKGVGGSSLVPTWAKDKRLEFQHMTAEMLEWQNIVLGLKIPSQQVMLHSHYQHAWLFQSAIVDSPKMLMHMLNQVQSHVNTIQVNVETGHYFETLEELIQQAHDLKCDTVINCTGLGARSLCQDEALVCARGILLHFDRDTVARTFVTHATEETTALTKDAAIFADEPPWGIDGYPCYLIPRRDILVVGGSYLEGDSRVEISEPEYQRLLENAKLLGIDVNQSPPKSKWVGFRPYRPCTKCEVDKTFRDVTLVHSYGHGGSGWTINVGVAKETATLLNL